MNHLRQAARRLAPDSGFSLPALTLALGIAGNAAIFGADPATALRGS